MPDYTDRELDDLIQDSLPEPELPQSAKQPTNVGFESELGDLIAESGGSDKPVQGELESLIQESSPSVQRKEMSQAREDDGFVDRLVMGFTQKEKPEDIALIDPRTFMAGPAGIGQQIAEEPERIPGSLESVGQIAGSVAAGTASGGNPLAIAGGGIAGGIGAEAGRQVIGNTIRMLRGELGEEENVFDVDLAKSAFRVGVSEAIGLGLYAGATTPITKKLLQKGIEWTAPGLRRNRLMRELADQSTEFAAVKKGVLEDMEKNPDLDPTIIKDYTDAIKATKSRTRITKVYQAHQRLVDSLNANKPKSFKHQIGDAVESAYLVTIPIIRGLDHLDGFQHYKGWNAERGKLVHQTATIVDDDILLRKQKFYQTLQDRFGIKDIDVHLDRRLRIHSLKEQEGGDVYAKQLADRFGLRKVYDSTPSEQERKIIDQAIETFGEKKRLRLMARRYFEKTGKKFRRIQNYSGPVLFENDPHQPLDAVLDQLRKHKRTPRLEQRFKDRTGFGKADVTESFFGALNTGIEQQERFIRLFPILEQNKRDIASDAWLKMMGNRADKATKYWAQVHKAIETNGSIGTSDFIQAGLRKGRVNIQQAVLAFNPSSAAIQPFAILDAIAWANIHYPKATARKLTTRLMQTLFNPKLADEIARNSPHLRVRAGFGTQDVAIQEALSKVGTRGFKKAMTKFRDAGLFPLRHLDKAASAAALDVFEQTLKADGIPNAKLEAGWMMDMVAANALPSFRPLILSQNEYLKTMLTFHTFILNRWSIMAHDAAGYGIKGAGQGNVRNAARGLISLGVVGAGEVAEDMGRKFIYEATTGNKIPDRGFQEDLTWALPRNVPLLGPMAEAAFTKRPYYGPPTFRFMNQLVRGVSGIGNSSYASSRRKAMGQLVEAGGAVAGVPGISIMENLATRFYGKPTKRERRMIARRRKG